jgi:hypothetical protein
MASSNPATIEACLCDACDAAQSACCKSGSVFLAPDEHARLVRHCAESGDAALEQAFDQRVAVHDGFAMLDQRDGCMFLDAGNRCTLHAIGLKPQECHWWPLHVYREADDRDGEMSVCLADYCCDGIRSMEDARVFLGFYLARMIELLPALRKFRAVFPGSMPRRPVMKIARDRTGASA